MSALLSDVEVATGAGQCSICLEEMEEGSQIVKLPCGHLFHKTCVSKWLRTGSQTCPLCKEQFRVDA